MASEATAAIILAAGSSSRMGGVDKLFASVCGRPLLAYTITPFQQCHSIEQIVLVLSQNNLEWGRDLVARESFDKVRAICLGGERRQDSVRAGLATLRACQWVLVHDGARPLVSVDLIERGLEVAAGVGAAVPALPVVDTIKEIREGGLVQQTLPRHTLWAVQTPQTFRYDWLLEAHQRIKADVTDDAAMLEELGYPVKVYLGDRHNVKITSPDDLALLEALLAEQ